MGSGEVDEAFAGFVAALDAATVVVTLAAGGERSGCLVGFHSQCSIDPPRYAVWLSKVNHTFGLLGSATHLAVHALASDDVELAELFGGETGDEVDKFARCTWTAGPGGVPLLAGCVGWFAGQIVGVTDEGGDHACVVVAPVRVAPVAVDPGPEGGAGADGAGGPVDDRLMRRSDVQGLEPGHPA